MAIPHTIATGMGTDWRDNNPDLEPLEEIYQGDRVSAEYEGAPKQPMKAIPLRCQAALSPRATFGMRGRRATSQARKPRPILSTHISYACTIATDGTRKGLLDAMRARHSYGATDNFVLDYRLVASFPRPASSISP